MKIIIAGAGDVGFHLAKLLSNESKDTYVIDSDAKKLKYIDDHLDVITLKGDATSLSSLKDVGIANADLILAVTESQNTNLTIAALSKKTGGQENNCSNFEHRIFNNQRNQFCRSWN